MKARGWSNVTKSKVEINQPSMVSQYTQFMGGGWPAWPEHLVVADRNLVQKVVLAYNCVLAADCHAQCLDVISQCRCSCHTATFTFTVHSWSMKYTMQSLKHVHLCLSVTLKHCPSDIRFDGVGHFTERNSTQIRCAVCRMRVYKKCTKCGVYWVFRRFSHKITYNGKIDLTVTANFRMKHEHCNSSFLFFFLFTASTKNLFVFVCISE